MSERRTRAESLRDGCGALPALAALALHLGGVALAIAHLQGTDDADGLGANGVEIAFEMASPKVTDDQLPPGPDSDASMASPQLAEQKAEVKETELPKDKPNEDETPDRIVTENKSKKPKEDDPKIAAVQTQASTESIAQEATSRQTLDEKAPEAETGKCAQSRHRQGQAKTCRRLGPPDQRLFRAAQALSEGEKEQDGDGQGQPCSQPPRQCRRRSAFWNPPAIPAYDEAAISMVRRSDPVPRPPAGLTQDTFNYTLPVNFNERK